MSSKIILYDKTGNPVEITGDNAKGLASGWSGSYTTHDGKTVTVVNGIITGVA